MGREFRLTVPSRRRPADRRSTNRRGLLFEPSPDARLGFGLFDLELAQLFARRVDLLCKDSIHRLLKVDILSEARVIYAA